MDQISLILNELFLNLSPIFRLIFVFLFSYMEGLPIIGSFFPGGTIALLVGTLVQDGHVNAYYAITIIAFGSFLGDMTGFLMGRKFKHKKWIKKIIENEKHQGKWDLFDRRIVLIILFSRVIPIVRSLPALFAGARNVVRLQKYIVLSLLGSFIWAITGIFGGKLISKLAGNLAIPVILGIGLLFIVVPFITNKFKKSE